MISLHTIKTTSPKPKRQTISVQDGSGVFLVIEPKVITAKDLLELLDSPEEDKGKRKK